MNMESPIGYPPPTLVRRRSGRAKLVMLLLALMLLATVIGAWGIGRMVRTPPARPAPRPVAAPPVQAADLPAAAMPDASAKPVVTVETPDSAGATQPSVDGRKANQWYYVGRLGDGPAAIYSRNGGQWSYAFACTPQTKMVEFIAVNTGSPGTFDKQSIVVGKTRLMMDAGYSADGGGTISTSLPAGHPFLRALNGTAPMEIQLYETRKTIVPVGPALVRLVRDCRGRG